VGLHRTGGHDRRVDIVDDVLLVSPADATQM
jgi:hypothetical protein